MVLCVQQTVIDAVRAKNGGVLTEADAAAAKIRAIAMLKANLGDGRWIARAQQILGVSDIEAYLEAYLEAAVKRMANAAPPVPAPPLPVQVRAPYAAPASKITVPVAAAPAPALEGKG